MSDLISRQAAMAYPLSWEHYDMEHGDRKFICGVESYREYIEQLPSTDHTGHWIDRTEEHGDSIGIYPWEVFKCSECGHLTAGNEFKFCPNCGADMRGEQND